MNLRTLRPFLGAAFLLMPLLSAPVNAGQLSLPTAAAALTTNQALAVSGSVNALDFADNGDLWVGGDFHTLDNKFTNLVRLRAGTYDIPPEFGFNYSSTNQVTALKSLPGGAVLAAFKKLKLARIEPDGTFRTDFVSSVGKSDTVSSITADPTQGFVLTLGEFNPLASPSRSSMRIFDDGGIDSEFDQGQFGPSRDGKYWKATGSPRRFIVTDSNGDNIATNFNLQVFGIPRQLVFRPDGRILSIGGTLVATNGTRYSGVVQMLKDGSIDPSFSTNGLSSVDASVLQPDGKVILGGRFTSFLGRPANAIVRLNRDGTFDESFPATPGADGAVSAIAIGPDGVAWFGGSFSNFNGTASLCLASLSVAPFNTPGQIGFKWTRVGTIENESSVNVEVIRLGSGNGDVTATLRFKDGDDISPIHFSSGDFVPKTIPIPLSKNNDIADGDRSLFVLLDSATGATIIDDADTCEIRIEDDETGLIAEYYNMPLAAQISFSQAVVNQFGGLARVARDPRVHFNWDLERPVFEISTNLFSVVWRGSFVPDISGPHTFQALHDDGIRIWLDGDLILDAWLTDAFLSPPDAAKTVILTAGQEYPIEIHFFNNPLNASVDISLKEYRLRRRHFRPTNNSRVPVTCSPNLVTRHTAIGASSQFTPKFVGSPPVSVHWYFNGTEMAGHTDFSLLVTNVTLDSAGIYSFYASNAAGSCSNNFTMIVGAAPTLTTTNWSQFAKVGDDLTFSISEIGDQPITNFWSKDGVVLDPNSVALEISPVTQAEAGLYRFFARNAFGASTTNQFRLYVLDHDPAPTRIRIDPTNQGTLMITAEPTLRFQLQTSSDLINWNLATNLVANGSSMINAPLLTNEETFVRTILVP
jgi:hypothetical protein